MQTFPDLDMKFSQRHRVHFGTCEDAAGNIVRAVHFPDLEMIVAGPVLRTMTVFELIQLAERCQSQRPTMPARHGRCAP
jgi:hypothetical protein